ncbi:hypothetical protein [Roseovarius spongiae]|uniref:hypothetical protein n=1 Tax=Roseovarius spongiae TaxID=2320272 RepID=UPI00197DCF03|nr:hypothetical protein [Roseovarius spongiae]
MRRWPVPPVLALLALTACGDTGGDEALASAGFYGGAVVVSGPAGYCVDRRTVRRRAGGGFALLTTCAALSDEAAPPASPAVITVSVLPFDATARQPRASEIAARFAPVKPLAARDGKGIALLHLPQGGDRGVPGGDPRYWRASMVVGGHLVGLAAYGRRGSAVAGPEGGALLRDLAARIRAASPPAAPPAAAADDPARTVSAKPRTRGLRGMFPGLFPEEG